MSSHPSPPQQRTALQRGRWGVALVVMSMASSIAAAPAAVATPSYRFIVHPSSRPAPVDRAFIAQVFLRKVRTWPDGDTMQPVDLDQESELRQQISVEVIGRSVASIRSYWQQMIFSGRGLPPPELSSEDAVVTFVLRHPGSIGYVSSKTNLRGALILPLK